jgi:hypothetical protein
VAAIHGDTDGKLPPGREQLVKPLDPTDDGFEFCKGPFCLVLTDAVRCKPIPCRGELALWRWQN